MSKEETASITIAAGLVAVILYGFSSKWWITDSVSTNALYAIIIAAVAIKRQNTIHFRFCYAVRLPPCFLSERRTIAKKMTIIMRAESIHRSKNGESLTSPAKF
jgi:hypothetical protein